MLVFDSFWDNKSQSLKSINLGNVVLHWSIYLAKSKQQFCACITLVNAPLCGETKRRWAIIGDEGIIIRIDTVGVLFPCTRLGHLEVGHKDFFGDLKNKLRCKTIVICDINWGSYNSFAPSHRNMNC